MSLAYRMLMPETKRHAVDHVNLVHSRKITRIVRIKTMYGS